eukprot:4557442-Prymnesium_polylepis.1
MKWLISTSSGHAAQRKIDDRPRCPEARSSRCSLTWLHSVRVPQRLHSDCRTPPRTGAARCSRVMSRVDAPLST